MEHPDAAQLQAFLNGGIGSAESDEVGEHLSRCDRCAARLARLEADDAFLTGSLALTEQERAWLESLDLAGQVQRQLAPSLLPRPALWASLLLLLSVGWLQEQVRALVGQAVAWSGPIGITVQLARSLSVGLWRLSEYILNGGLLPRVWPALALGAVLWFLRRHLKGANRYA